MRPAGCGCFRCPRGMAVGTRAVLIEKKLLVQAGFPGEGFPGHDFAGEVAAEQSGALPSLVHEAGVIEIGRRQDALHRPPDPRQPHQGAGVDALDADDAVSGQKRFQRFLRAEVANPAAELANHEASDPGATALQILVVDPVIADFGVGHRHDLTVIGGVGKDLLITRHARVEDDLAIDLAPGAKGPAGKDRTVLEREFRRVHRHYRGRSAATPEPGCLIRTDNPILPGQVLMRRVTSAGAARAVSFSERDWQCLLKPSWLKLRASGWRCLAGDALIFRCASPRDVASASSGQASRTILQTRRTSARSPCSSARTAEEKGEGTEGDIVNCESNLGKLGSLSVSSYSPYSMRAIHYVSLGPLGQNHWGLDRTVPACWSS